MTSETPVKIYGLIGDSQSKVRRDFRIVGARNNTQWTSPDQNVHLPLPNHPDQPQQVITTDELLEKIEELLENLDDIEKIALELAQVQRAGLRRHAVTQIGHNRFKFETHEAADAFRGLLIEVAFQVEQSKFWS